MFGRVYLGELKKIFRIKSLIAILVVCAVFFLLFAVVYNMDIDVSMDDFDVDMGENWDIDLDMGVEPDGGMTDEEKGDIYGYIDLDFIHIANKDNVDKIIASLEEYKENREPEGLDFIFGYSDYYVDSAIATLRYMKETDTYGEDINVEGYYSYYSMKSAESFVQTCFELVLLILSIYGIVMGAGLYADEYASGTIKLTMLRPIGRNTLTTAKLLAMFTMLVGISAGITLVAFLYGWAAYGSVATTAVIVPFNSVTAYSSTVGALVLGDICFGILSILAISTLSFAIGTISRKKTLGIVLSILMYLGVLSGIFTVFGGDRFLYTTNMNLSVYFGMDGPTMEKANFYLALPLFVVYTAGTLTATYITVKKRDIV